MRDSGNAAGWWQGNEACLNLTSGGAVGVVYGAGGLWQRKLFPDDVDDLRLARPADLVDARFVEAARLA